MILECSLTSLYISSESPIDMYSIVDSLPQNFLVLVNNVLTRSKFPSQAHAAAPSATFPPPSDDDTSSAPSRTGHHDQAGSADLISSRHVQTKQNTSLN